MSSQHYQETHARLLEAGQHLLDSVRELRWAHWNLVEDAESFASIQADVQRALEALREQRFQVAAIAAMKAGKSTLLNALIGADVLASETEACTVCRTDIRPIGPHQQPRLLEYRAGSRTPVLIAAGEAATIRQQFLDRTHAIRATGNRDRTLRFELEHPIAALGDLPALRGFTLVDTPGPNEWSSAGFNTVALKETALAALRTCDAILFILDYTTFKDNTNAELLQDLLEQRQDYFAHRRGTLYFILNKIDRHTAEDRPIAQVIEDLQRNLQAFGISEPQIYPASAWQGLLAKLILKGRATDAHLKNFKRFFGGHYARETEEGDLLVPSPQKIAPQALADSAIPQIEQAVIGTVIAHSGWNLLHDALATLVKAAAGSEDILKARIRGWQMEIAPLRQRLEEYKQLAKLAIIQVRQVKTLIEQQERKLVAQFKAEISDFAERAKLTIQQEFERFAQERSAEPLAGQTVAATAVTLPVPQRVADSLQRALKDVLGTGDRPFQVRCQTPGEVERVKQDINRFCAILIKNWWVSTQDKLSRQGAEIRQELVAQICEQVQQISNELSNYLGEALDITLNVNPIQILMFDFQGIDTQVQRQTENYSRWTKERRKAFCHDYEVDIQVEDRRDCYQIDLQQTLKAIAREIDAQMIGSLTVVEKAIKQQVADDFRHVEQQINDYIHRFLIEFERLLQEREQQEAAADNVIMLLAERQEQLAHVQARLGRLQAEFDRAERLMVPA